MSNKFNHFSLRMSHLALNILLKSIACFSKLQKFNSSVKHKLVTYGSEKHIKKNKSVESSVTVHKHRSPTARQCA